MKSSKIPTIVSPTKPTAPFCRRRRRVAWPLYIDVKTMALLRDRSSPGVLASVSSPMFSCVRTAGRPWPGGARESIRRHQSPSWLSRGGSNPPRARYSPPSRCSSPRRSRARGRSGLRDGGRLVWWCVVLDDDDGKVCIRVLCACVWTHGQGRSIDQPIQNTTHTRQ